MPERIQRTVKTFNIDLSVPVDKSVFKEEQNNTKSCLGKMWDLSHDYCRNCGDKDICGILYKDLVDARAAALQTELGSIYLDVTDFDNLTDDKVFNFVKSGVTTTKQLLEYVGKTANTSDKVAMTEWIKRFIARNAGKVKTEGGIVWVS